MRVRASRTSSSLNGLMTAMTSFMVFLPGRVFGWRLIYSENPSPLDYIGVGLFGISRGGRQKPPRRLPAELIRLAYRPPDQKLSGIIAASQGVRRAKGHFMTALLSYLPCAGAARPRSWIR